MQKYEEPIMEVKYSTNDVIRTSFEEGGNDGGWV